MEYIKRQIEELDKKITETKKLLEDPSLVSLASEELKKLEEEKHSLQTSENKKTTL